MYGPCFPRNVAVDIQALQGICRFRAVVRDRAKSRFHGDPLSKLLETQLRAHNRDQRELEELTLQPAEGELEAKATREEALTRRRAA